MLAMVRIYTLFTLSNRAWGSRNISVINNQVVRVGDKAEKTDSSTSSTPTNEPEVILEMSPIKTIYETETTVTEQNSTPNTPVTPITPITPVVAPEPVAQETNKNNDN
jgi:hypothetical protein